MCCIQWEQLLESIMLKSWMLKLCQCEADNSFKMSNILRLLFQFWIFWEYVSSFSTFKILSDSYEIRIHNHLVRKQTPNHLTSMAKWLSVRLRTKWLWVQIPLLSLKQANYWVWFYSESRAWHDNNIQF